MRGTMKLTIEEALALRAASVVLTHADMLAIDEALGPLVYKALVKLRGEDGAQDALAALPRKTL